MAFSVYFGPKTPKGAWASYKGGEREAKRGRAALECCASFFFFFSRRNFCTDMSSHTPHVEAFLGLFCTRFLLDCSSLGLNGSHISHPQRRKIRKLAHLRDWRRERGRDRQFFFSCFLSSQEKKAFENHKKGQKRVTKKAAVVGLLWIPRNSFGFC